MSHPTQGQSEWGNDHVQDVCEHFQMDLSCLVDGELDEATAARAMVHLEECAECREFFDDTRQCLRLHLDVADPDRLLARVSALTGTDIAKQAQGIELVSRLATLFYQLGKAYLLAAIDPDWRTRVFEAALPVEPTQTRGRGFVDGVLSSGEEHFGGVDWTHARHMLNGRLKQIQSPLEKGRKLLEEALDADATHEEARLYLAFLHAHEGKLLQAAGEYEAIFRSASCDTNRGHAAVQLGRLHEAEGNHEKALVFFRWVTISGLERREQRFFFVHFNIGLQYALLSERARSLSSFRRLLDRHPGRLSEITPLFGRSKSLQQAIENDAEFARELVATCPELFGGPSPQRGPDPDPEEQDT